MIAIGCDHGGYHLKQEIIQYLNQKKIPFRDYGVESCEPCDYPIFAKQVAKAVAAKECEFGILICSTGIGISIAANKVKGIRAALCHDCFSAEATRQHNDANILAMGAKIIGSGLAVKITDIFLNTSFSEEERHSRRINMIESDDLN